MRIQYTRNMPQVTRNVQLLGDGDLIRFSARDGCRTCFMMLDGAVLHLIRSVNGMPTAGRGELQVE